MHFATLSHEKVKNKITNYPLGAVDEEIDRTLRPNDLQVDQKIEVHTCQKTHTKCGFTSWYHTKSLIDIFVDLVEYNLSSFMLYNDNLQAEQQWRH